jgi:hypothetical protein
MYPNAEDPMSESDDEELYDKNEFVEDLVIEFNNLD